MLIASVDSLSLSFSCRSDTSLSEVFSNDFWGAPLASNESHKSYRPLTVLTLRFNRQMHGMWAPGFHAVNVLLHAAVSALYTLLCSRLLAPPTPRSWWGGAVTAGGLFAAHPIHTEAVSLGIRSGLQGLPTRRHNRELYSHKGHISGLPNTANKASEERKASL